MRQIGNHKLWIGHSGEARDMKMLLNAGIEAIMDLAGNEPSIPAYRAMLYCRFPLIDGSGNPPWLVRLAIETVSKLIKQQIPTLVFCSLGMSRSPAITVGAIAMATGASIADCLHLLKKTGVHDVSGGLLHDVIAIIKGGPDTTQSDAEKAQ